MRNAVTKAASSYRIAAVHIHLVYALISKCHKLQLLETNLRATTKSMCSAFNDTRFNGRSDIHVYTGRNGSCRSHAPNLFTNPLANQVNGIMHTKWLVHIYTAAALFVVTCFYSNTALQNSRYIWTNTVAIILE